ncbi:hypothetical protein V6N11_081898 [Hibiscus sabdariffa]|uniref:Uncharacterized protein n=1 Tax=Hibiscus sabdariffa TaxID=183260 RepID=A0ABR2Q7W9_9ROSI
MESKNSICNCKPHYKDVAIDTLELDSDDTINVAIKSLSLVDKQKNSGRRVDTNLEAERQMVIPADNYDDIVEEMSDHQKSTINSNFKPGISDYPRINQKASEETFKDFCPISYVTKHGGIWKSSGSGLIENDEVVEFAFAPGSNEGPSNIISKVEKLFKGKAKGSKRLSGIKQAAREEFVKETIRKFNDEIGLLEIGRDPFDWLSLVAHVRSVPRTLPLSCGCSWRPHLSGISCFAAVVRSRLLFGIRGCYSGLSDCCFGYVFPCDAYRLLLVYPVVFGSCYDVVVSSVEGGQGSSLPSDDRVTLGFRPNPFSRPYTSMTGY